MTSKNQINQWTQQQQSLDVQKQLQNELKLAGVTMLGDIYDAIQHIKEYISSVETSLHNKQQTIVFREDCRALNYLCECIERVLLFGFKKKFFRSSSIWSFICDSTAKCTLNCQSLSTDINLIKSIEVLNDYGKYRAFLRQSLRSKAIPLYFKLMLEQTDIIQDYYWDYAVMSHHNQTIALQAQLEELNYLPSNIEFEMLLSDKALNIMEYFTITDHGIPEWNVQQDKGDISMMVDSWSLKNRDNAVIENTKNKHRKKHKHKHKHSKRKLNALTSTDDIRRSDDDDCDEMLQIDAKSKKKKPKSKKKKKKKRKKKRINNNNNNETQLRLTKQMDEHTTVIDDSQIIQNVLHQKHPKSPAVYINNSPTSSQHIIHIKHEDTDEMEQITIDDLIEEHLQKEEKHREIQSLFKTPTKYSKDMMSLHAESSVDDTPQSNTKPHAHYRRYRSSSYDDRVKSISKSYPKPNNFIRGTSSTQRPFEIVVIQPRTQRKRNNIYMGSYTPPPRSTRRRNGYRTPQRGIHISQSSSPSRRHYYVQNVGNHVQNDHKPRSNSDITESTPTGVLITDTNGNVDSTDGVIEAKAVYGKPMLSRKAKEFVEACSAHPSVDNSQTETPDNDKEKACDKVERVKEIDQKREHDEYDTEEDDLNTQQSTTYYESFSNSVYKYGDCESKNRVRLRRAKDEQLRRTAMKLDDKIRDIHNENNEKTPHSHSHSQLFDDKYDSNSEKDRINAQSDINITLNSNEDDVVFIKDPIPKQQKDRFSKYMKHQFQRRKRLETEDLSASFNNNESPCFNHNDSPSRSVESQSKGFSQKRIPTAIFAHNELKNEGGSDIRELIKKRDWHNGIEISWRTTPLPPRDNNALLLHQNFHCATCGLVLKSNFLRRAKYHYCRYLGLIHCDECHKQERAVIPHRVLYDLNCKPSTVCCAAKRYLDQMYNIPCITMSAFSGEDKVQNNWKIKQLKKVMFELKEIKTYLDVCRDRDELMDNIYKEYRHWIKYAGRLSLRDCVNIISFNTGDKLQILANKLKKHIVVDCDMCRGKGYYCEICVAHDVIYSFQYQQVEQCNICKACFHAECWEKINENCPRCKRRHKMIPQIK